ncbi:MAG: heavy metal-binding domain-containing protein, partial [Leeuwenhoekiella sp.]
MKHTYHIEGMSCNGCRSHVEKTLANVAGVNDVSVDLHSKEAVISMDKHIALKIFQQALKDDGGGYSIDKNPHPASPKGRSTARNQSNDGVSLRGSGGFGVFYCPMHCEGDKTYDQPGDCPVCGMDLVRENTLSHQGSDEGKYTCPMHPEVLKDEPGDCPICGMDLVPKAPDLSAEEKTYKKLLRKFWIAL